MSKLVSSVAIAGIALMAVPLAGCSSKSNYASDAIVGCEQQAQKQLKNPDSAKFHWDSSERDKGPANHMTLHGSVTAENTFGGHVTNDFTCDAIYLKDDDNFETRVTFNN